MKKRLLFLAASCSALFLGGCVYEDGYGTVRVSNEGYSPYYAGEYDEYSPYYEYSGRRYYRSNNRYVYYSNSRPFYVTSLPSEARYITPHQRDRSRSTYDRYHQEQATSRYNTNSQHRSYNDQRADSERSKMHSNDKPQQRNEEPRVRTQPPQQHREVNLKQQELPPTTQQASGNKKAQSPAPSKGQQKDKEKKKEKED
jgi:hypothetical protein